jgi:hypothetical protein
MEPFQEKFIVILSSGVANGGDFKTVPAGKRAVIEHVSVYDTGTGANTADYFFTSTIILSVRSLRRALSLVEWFGVRIRPGWSRLPSWLPVITSQCRNILTCAAQRNRFWLRQFRRFTRWPTLSHQSPTGNIR